MKKRALVFAVALSLLVMPALALADSISPSSIDFFPTPGVPFAFNVHKTVTVSAGTPTAAKVDVYYLADTTGSMFGQIANVKASATGLVGNIAALGDVTQGVGEYKDFVDPYAFRTNQALTATPPNNASVVAGINLWVASGGGDFPEANLYALYQVATTQAWRAASQRLIVQFGDAPGHDPSGGITEPMATAAMVDRNIKLLAINVGNKDATGQETRMTAATGGILTTETDPAKLTDTIESLITASFADYSSVKLDFSDLPFGVGVLPLTPTEIIGDYDRSIERVFEFDFILYGCCAVIGKPLVEFNIDALIDDVFTGARETDRIHCGPTVPVPGSLLFLGTGLIGLLGLRRRF